MNNTYSKQFVTFYEDGAYCNAVVYAGLDHPTDINANIHIADLGEENDGGRYMLTLGNDGWMADKLEELEPRLFEWMQSEGFEYDSQN